MVICAWGAGVASRQCHVVVHAVTATCLYVCMYACTCQGYRIASTVRARICGYFTFWLQLNWLSLVKRDPVWSRMQVQVRKCALLGEWRHNEQHLIPIMSCKHQKHSHIHTTQHLCPLPDLPGSCQHCKLCTRLPRWLRTAHLSTAGIPAELSDTLQQMQIHSRLHIWPQRSCMYEH